MNYYYYPLCTNDYVFDNMFASESVSPISFYKRRQFGIDYFYKIPNFHIENAILLFNQPPKFSVEKSNTDVIKFILAIDANYIKDEGRVSIGREEIFGYRKTIYLNKDNFKIYFFSEKDKKIALMKSENSLPTKGLKKYENNFSIMSENKCKEFNLNTEIIKIDLHELDNEIQFDRKFNYFKGLVYGISVGILSKKSKKEILIKRSLQEITNSFAELKNRIENNSRSSEQHIKYRSDTAFPNVITKLEEKLIHAIGMSEEVFNSLFPSQAFSEKEFVDFLMKDRPGLFNSIEKVKEAIELRKFDDEIDRTSRYKQLIDYYLIKSNKISFFDLLRAQSKNYLESSTFPDNYRKKEEANNNFKETLYKLEKFINNEFLKNTVENKFDFKSLKFDFEKNEISFDQDFQKLSQIEIEELTSIINVILNNSKYGKGETSKEQILTIVEKVGDVNSKKSEGGRTTTLFKYLNNEINEYPSNTPRSVVMSNFVAFTLNPDSLEKLQNYLEIKSIDNSWIGYCFWCAFNGFAKISKNFVKPIFDTDNDLMQREIDSYLEKSSLSIRNSKAFIITKANEKFDQNIDIDEPTVQYNKNQKFYNLYSIQDQFKISLDEFNEILLNRASGTNIKKIKICKKDLIKLFDVFDRFINGQDLFVM